MNAFCPTHIILMTGAKKHGKDSLSFHIENDHSFWKLAFADALKLAAAASMGLSVADFHSQEMKEKPLPGYDGWTYRSYLEDLGTSYFRHKFPGIWVNTVINKIRDARMERVVISDARFDDEIKRIMAAFPAAKVVLANIIDPSRGEELDGEYEPYDVMRNSAIFYAETNKTQLAPVDEIHVLTPKPEMMDKFRTHAATVEHVSAWSYRLFRPDYVIINNGTLDDLRKTAAKLVAKVTA